MTSRSMMGCLIDPLESMSPRPMAKSDRKEDIMVKGSTLRSKMKKKRKLKAKKHKSKKVRKQENNEK